MPEELRLLQGEAVTRLTDAEFFQFCQENPLQRFERKAYHRIIVTPPASPDASEDGADVAGQF